MTGHELLLPLLCSLVVCSSSHELRVGSRVGPDCMMRLKELPVSWYWPLSV